MLRWRRVRPENLKENRIDRRLAENKSDNRRVVIVARERCGRTITPVTKTEAEGLAFVERVVSPNKSFMPMKLGIGMRCMPNTP